MYKMNKTGCFCDRIGKEGESCMSTVVCPACMDCLPVVFAVGEEYQIFVPFLKAAVVWAKVGDETFYDDSNGILRSNSNIHRIHVPMRLLNEAKSYTVCYRIMIDRKPYFPTSEEEQYITLPFRPLREGKVNIYLLSDAHNLETEPIAAGRYFGDAIDLLVLNGDIPNHSGTIENFYSVYRIAAGITKGECPVVFARGNHDTRGIYAEEFSRYTPTHNDKTYYTFRLGSLWGMVLDCGEDKPDTNPEYGNTICFHPFRLQETKFIKDVIARKEKEYAAPGVKNRLVICHIPFTRIYRPPFDIEQELYAQWAKLMREEIRPQLFLFGHQHCARLCLPGEEWDQQGQACPAVIAGWPLHANGEEPSRYCAAAIELEENAATIVFNTNEGEILGHHRVDF